MEICSSAQHLQAVLERELLLTGTMLLLHVMKYILWPKPSIIEGVTVTWIFVVRTSDKEKNVTH